MFTIIKNFPIVISALLSSERFDQFGLSFICLYIVRTIAESLCFFYSRKLFHVKQFALNYL